MTVGGVTGLVGKLLIKPTPKRLDWNPSSSFYGKGLVKIQPWLRGIQRPDKYRTIPGWYLIGMVLGAAGLAAIAFFVYASPYIGLWAFVGMCIGLWVFGGREGVFQYGS
jgi:hypothetical protein